MSVRLADQSFQYPIGIAENMLVEVGKFTFLVDLVILEMEEDSKVPLILGRPFLYTVDAVIRVKQKQLNLGVGTERMTFSIDSAMKHSYSKDDTCFSIDVIDEILEEDFDALLDEGSKILHSMEGTIIEENLFAKFDEFMAMTIKENSESDFDKEPTFKKITFNTDYKIKTSLEEPLLDLELKPLHDHLEYVFLEEPSFLSVIISSQLTEQNKSKLIYVLKRHKQAFAWKITDIPGICPSFCKHKIQLLNDKKCKIPYLRAISPPDERDMIGLRKLVNSGTSLGIGVKLQFLLLNIRIYGRFRKGLKFWKYSGLDRQGWCLEVFHARLKACLTSDLIAFTIIMADLPLPDHVVDLPEDEPVHPEPAPIILHHAPAQPEGYVGDDDMEDDEEEDPEEEPEEDEPLEEDGVGDDEEEEMEMDENDEENGGNDNEDDAEVINQYKEVDPLNRPPATSDEEYEFPPCFGVTFMLERFINWALLAGNCRVSVPGLVGCSLESVHRGVKRLDRQMFNRYNTKVRMAKKFKKDDLRMNRHECDITALDAVEKPSEPPIHPAFAPRSDDPYVIVKDAAIAARDDDGDDTTAPMDSQPSKPHGSPRDPH
ncbi:reverse transcriptase domain-containing protein [Tanacetum coccineum]